MFNPIFNITIKQRTNGRSDELSFDFCESFEWNSSWKNMTDSGKIVLPRNLYFTDKYGTKHPLAGSTQNVGGFTESPFFMRGDSITLDAGYTYFNKEGLQIFETSRIIEGYISKVNSGTPIELEIEDSMWLLKQTPLENRTFKSTDTLESIITWIVGRVNSIHGTSLTARALNVTNFGTELVYNETASQFLNRLHKKYGFNTYFRGTELRSGSLIYVESESQNQTFIMNGINGNVLAEGQDLTYQRKDDVVLSAIAHNVIEESSGGTTKDGHPKTKKNRLEVLVTIKNGQRSTKVIQKGQSVPANDEGERMEFYFVSAKTTDELADLAYDKLIQNYYDGLRGKFRVYGIPFIRHGDYATIINPQQPEQNGTYKVKGVYYYGGINDGLRQEPELDYKRK